LKSISKSNKKHFLLLILLNIFITYNPPYLYYLLKNGLLNGITIYISLSSVAIVISLLYILATANSILKFNKYAILSPISLFTFFVMIGICFSFAYGNDLNKVIIDLFPIVQFILGYVLISFSKLSISDIYQYKISKRAYHFIFITVFSALFTYIYFILIGHNFGVLRAHISGVTIGRLPDFIFPIFVVGFLFYKRENKLFIVILKLIAIVYLALSMYRTIYVAIFISIIYMAIIEREKIFKRTKPLIFIILIGIVSNIMISEFSNENSAFDLYAGKLFERVGTIFEVKDRPEETSRSGRLNQLYYFESVIHNPLGFGFGGIIYEPDDKYELNAIPFYTMAFYPLQIMLSIGLTGGLIFMYLLLKTLKQLHRLRRHCKDKVTYMGLGYISSGMIVIIIFLLLFPYVVYFPITFILGLMIGLTNNEYNLYSLGRIHER